MRTHFIGQEGKKRREFYQSTLRGAETNMADSREWIKETNPRGYIYTCCKGRHVAVPQLIKDFGNDITAPFPYSVLFSVSEVCHVTGDHGLQGIMSDDGFRASKDGLLWWSLSVSEHDIALAETKFLTSLFPLPSNSQMPFLNQFTTSPTFQRESRYGTKRFTFPLRELLSSYSRQFCQDSSLVLRVLNTRIYRKEIEYSIVVHPANVKRYQDYPRLPRDEQSVCAYSDGRVMWRCQAPSDNLKWALEVDREKQLVNTRPLMWNQYSVWDNVTLAFHMEPGWVLHIDHERLSQCLSSCDVAPINLLRTRENQH